MEGLPVAAGPISAWAAEIAKSSESSEKPKRRVKGRGDPTLSDRSLPLNPSGVKKAQTRRLPPEEKPMKTARGTSMGGKATARERAGAGLMPVAGLDVTLEHAESFPQGAVTATVQALSDLIEKGRPEFRDQHLGAAPPAASGEERGRRAAPHRLAVRAEGRPADARSRSWCRAIREAGERTQVLLGVTGSGKTFTMAKVIEATQRPALILAPNKTLAAQLYGEFKSFFPENAVEYFVSYYDYYQPEAYVPRTDTYIEKESSINEQIDRMRHSATRTLLERDDVIIVASVSCIYGIGSVETYTAMTFGLEVGARRQPAPGARRPGGAAIQAHRHRISCAASFRLRGDTLELFPAHLEDRAWRISFFGDEIESIQEFDPLTGQKTGDLKSVKIYANSHYVTPKPTLQQAIKGIREELQVAAGGAGEGGPAARSRSGSCSARSSTSR